MTKKINTTYLTNHNPPGTLLRVSAETLPEVNFSEAKSGLSDVMNSVVHQHQPQLVQRHGGKETMLLVRPDDLRRWLDTFRFTLSVTLGEDEVAVSAAPLGVIGLGDSFESALDDLLVELRLYARRFFAQPQFYGASDRAGHYPWLLRFALTRPDEQLDLLQDDLASAR